MELRMSQEIVLAYSLIHPSTNAGLICLLLWLHHLFEIPILHVPEK